MTNKEIVEQFYKAFGRKDYKTMNECYAPDIFFSDPVFGFLQGDEVRAMWQMLCMNGNELKVSFDDIVEIDHEYLTCKWVASYRFGATGREVVNYAKAFMKIREGKIVEHSDGFRLSTWLAQAFGLKGKLFGWTNFMKRRVQKNARKKLEAFMSHQSQY